MAILAKRFEDLTEETNVGISDFFSDDARSIWNSANNEFKEMAGEVKDFLKSLNEMKDEADVALAPVADAVRSIRDMIPSMRDIENLAMSEIDDMIGELGFGEFNDGQITSLLRSLTKSCKQKGLSGGNFGKPFGLNMDCNGKKRKGNTGGCGTPGLGSFASALGKLTGGNFGAILQDLNHIMNSVMALANIGYNMNLCGVFSALTKIVPDMQIIPRAAIGVIGNLNSTQNTYGILDMAGATAGFNLPIEKPNLISETSRNFAIPFDTKQNGYSDMGTRFNGALELFQDGYDRSPNDPNRLSVERLTYASDDYRNISNIQSRANAFDSSSLDVIPNADTNFMNMALQFE